MPTSVRDQLLRLHERLLKLEKGTANLGIPGYGGHPHHMTVDDSVKRDEERLEELYESLCDHQWSVVNNRRCGWKLNSFDGEYLVTGSGRRGGCLYSLEIECRNALFYVSCFEEMDDYDREDEPDQLTHATASVREVESWLDETFPR